MKVNSFLTKIQTLSRSRSISGFGTKFFIALTIVLAASCKKEGDIGVDVLPDSDIIGLETTDTTFLVTYAVAEDSIRSDEYPVVQIGSYNDPYFGKTTASLFTQISIPSGKHDIYFGSTAVFDSSYLWLEYEYDYYGDTMTPQTFKVYQLTDDLYKDSVYYSNQTRQFSSNVVGSIVNFAPHPRQEVVFAGDTTPAALIIKMDQAWGQNIFDQSGTTNMHDNADFTSWQKGIYIAPDSGYASGMGAMLRFVPRDSLTRLRLYYHDSSGPKFFDFTIGTATAFFNHFDHNYSTTNNTELISQLTNGYNAANDNVFVQGASGVKTKIEFPYLDSWKNLGSRIAINKAELVIKASNASSVTDNYPLNKELYLVSLDSAGTQYLLSDWFEGSTYFGGTLLTTSNEYRINMARHFQRLVDGDDDNYGLYLKEIYPFYESRRGILGSGNPNSTNQYKMYLHLVYTRIN